MSACRKWQEGDEYACTCGLRWGTDEKDPHNYAAEYKAQALVVGEHQGGGRDVTRHETARNNIKKLREKLCTKI